MVFIGYLPRKRQGFGIQKTWLAKQIIVGILHRIAKKKVAGLPLLLSPIWGRGQGEGVARTGTS
jgi:hypothetical protein